MFQHTAARRRLGFVRKSSQPSLDCFNTQPPEGGWEGASNRHHCYRKFQHTAARRRLDQISYPTYRQYCFNTQPPEGGWLKAFTLPCPGGMFQHTAARRRLVMAIMGNINDAEVSTHSRPKAAGDFGCSALRYRYRFNTQPPEGGWLSDKYPLTAGKSFNTQPPEGGWTRSRCRPVSNCRFNTQPPEGGWFWLYPPRDGKRIVSTHSRPKAAGPNNRRDGRFLLVSTHSRLKAAGAGR